MIVSSMKVRIVKDAPGALEWAHEIGAVGKNTARNDVEVRVRRGATQHSVWLQRFQDLSAYEKSLGAVRSDPDYQARVKKAQSREFFDSPNIEAGIWRQF